MFRCIFSIIFLNRTNDLEQMMETELVLRSGGTEFFRRVCKHCEKRLLASSFPTLSLSLSLSLSPPFCLHETNSAPTRSIFVEFDIWPFFRESSEQIESAIKIWQYSLHEDLCKFIVISPSVLLKIGIVSDEVIAQHTHFMFNIHPPTPSLSTRN